MHRKTVIQIINSIKNKEFSVVDLITHFLNRIEKSKTNAFITILNEDALKKAKEADVINKKNIKELPFGIPFVHKDAFCVENKLTTCSSKMLKKFLPNYNATIHKKLIENGFILLGKTNMDEFCMGCGGEKTIFAPTKNPWNINYSPGGSSSGSAVCVAENLCPIATGSDTGGSIRQPAAYCGITAIKPTYGRISRNGLISFAASLDHCGLFAKTAKDCALILDIISGFDKNDLTTINQKKTHFLENINYKKENTIIGIPKEFFTKLKSKDIYKKWEETINLFTSLKIKIKYINLKNINLYTILYRTLAFAECASNLARYDSIRFNIESSQIQENFSNFYTQIRSLGFGKEVKKRILLGTFLLTKYNNNSLYENANFLRKTIINDYRKIFKEVNLILTPTTLTTAHYIKKKYHEKEQIETDKTTCVSNITGMPAITFPVGLSALKLPIGMQIIANSFNEQTLLNIVHYIQENTTWHLETNKLT